MPPDHSDQSKAAPTIPSQPRYSLAGLPLALKIVLVVIALVGGWLAVSFTRYLLADGVLPGFADKDFANYWVAAHLAAEGRVTEVFGPHAVYFADMVEAMRPAFPWHNWSYPPHYLLLMMPLALTGYKVGAAIFMAVTGAFFWTGLMRFFKGPKLLALTAVGPLAVLNLWALQNGFLTSGLALWFLALRARQPILAGICLGLLTIKPQLGLLFPILLILERRWTVMLVAALTTAVIVLASIMAFGPGVWPGYLHEIMPYQYQVMTQFSGMFLTMMPSIFGMTRLQGYPADIALLVHLSLAVPALIITTYALVKVRQEQVGNVLIPIATVLVTPYALNYDMGIVGAAVASFIWQEEQAGRPFSAMQIGLFALAMLAPATMMIAGRYSIGTAPFILGGVFLIMVHRAVSRPKRPREGARSAALPPGIGAGADLPRPVSS